MNRYVHYTLAIILMVFVVLGSWALAEWRPPEKHGDKEFELPVIYETDLSRWADQELCFLVLRDEIGYFVDGWQVFPHFPQKRPKWNKVRK